MIKTFDKRGHSSLEAMLIMGIMLQITLYFTVRLVMTLFDAGICIGSNTLDLSALYNINGSSVSSVNGSHAARRLEHAISIEKIPLIPMTAIESTNSSGAPGKQSLEKKADKGDRNRLVRWMPAWQIQINQCIQEVYGRMAGGSVKGIDADKLVEYDAEEKTGGDNE